MEPKQGVMFGILRDINSFVFCLMILANIKIVLCDSTMHNKYQRTRDRYLQNSFVTVTAVSRIKCCGHCEDNSGCMSVSYNNISGTCQLSIDPLVIASVSGIVDSTWNIYSKNDWMLVFRGTPGAGSNLYTAWVDGVSVTTDDETCMTSDVTTCNKHYRNSIVDSWEAITMSQVKFAMYKNNVEVAYVIFDGAGSNLTSWFTLSRVLQSSWTTLQNDTFNYFSILGHYPGRSFYINRNYGGCPVDKTYVAVIEASDFGCSYDYQASYPQLLYANTDTYGSPETMTDMDVADVMTIFIK